MFQTITAATGRRLARSLTCGYATAALLAVPTLARLTLLVVVALWRSFWVCVGFWNAKSLPLGRLFDDLGAGAGFEPATFRL